jgi:hypothetical protein
MTGAEIAESGKILIELSKVLMQRLAEAQKRALEDVARCKTDLGVASEAIFGLENEYTGILNTARNSNRDDQLLRTRLKNYLTQDYIYHHLRSALDDLERCRGQQRRSADTFLQWPWKRKDRQEAVAAFAELLEEFNKYYNNLAAKGMALEDNPSGFNWRVLKKLEDYLDDPNDKRMPAQVVDALKAEHEAKEGEEFLKKTKDYINTLEDAFLR